MKNKYILWSGSVFVVLAVVIFFIDRIDPSFNKTVLAVGNVVLMALSVAGYMMMNAGKGSTPGAQLRGVQGASILRIMVCLFSMLIYIFMNREHVHKPTIFVLMGMYAMYSVVEKMALLLPGARKN